MSNHKNPIVDPADVERRLGLCFECDSASCAYNQNQAGICMYPVISGREPIITDLCEAGCDAYVYCDREE